MEDYLTTRFQWPEWETHFFLDPPRRGALYTANEQDCGRDATPRVGLCEMTPITKVRGRNNSPPLGMVLDWLTGWRFWHATLFVKAGLVM